MRQQPCIANALKPYAFNLCEPVDKMLRDWHLVRSSCAVCSFYFAVTTTRTTDLFAKPNEVVRGRSQTSKQFSLRRAQLMTSRQIRWRAPHSVGIEFVKQRFPAP